MNDAPKPNSEAGASKAIRLVGAIPTGAANTEAEQLDRYNAMRDVGIDALGAYITECGDKGRFPRQSEASERIVSAMVEHAVRITIKAGICTLMDRLESQPIYIDDATGT